MSKAIVSVVIVTYNRADELRKAIDSVLAQSYSDYELIIVDDCSTDNTEVVVKSFNDKRIQYRKLDKNTGGSFIPRQIGQETSIGKYIAVLDDDDYWVDNRKLQLQVSYLNDHPECVLVGTNAVGIDKNGTVVFRAKYPQDSKSIRNKMLIRNLFYHSSVVYRREAYRKSGGYEILNNGHYGNYANEYDLWLKMGVVGELANLSIYGVEHISDIRVLNTKTRIEYMVQHIKDINKYKSYYPNYCKAFAISILFAIIEVPILVRLKSFILGKVFG